MRSLGVKLLLLNSLYLLIACYRSPESENETNDEIDYTVAYIPGSSTDLGKRPHWDNETQSLYYVDYDGKLLRYDYIKNKVYSCKVPHKNTPFFMIPVEGNTDKFAVGFSSRVVIVAWDGKSANCTVDRTIFEVNTAPEGARYTITTGKCDSKGRLLISTLLKEGSEFIPKNGTLYKYENGKVEKAQTEVDVLTGMAWNDALKKFYFIDSCFYNVQESDYDIEKGLGTNPQVQLDLNQNNRIVFIPEDIAIDSDGNLYIIHLYYSIIYKYDPRKREILKRIRIPCNQLSSISFGGPNLDILYVATSSRSNEPKPAGYLFKVTGLGVKGLPEPKMRI